MVLLGKTSGAIMRDDMGSFRVDVEIENPARIIAPEVLPSSNYAGRYGIFPRRRRDREPRSPGRAGFSISTSTRKDPISSRIITTGQDLRSNYAGGVLDLDVYAERSHIVPHNCS